MIPQQSSDPAALRKQVESLTADLARLVESFKNGSLKFQELNAAFVERRPRLEALVNGLLSYVPKGDSRIDTLFQSGNLRYLYSDDLGIVGAPLLEKTAITHLRLVMDRLNQLAGYLPNPSSQQQP